MKEQTFVISLLDSKGRTINFERWSYKRLNTCITKTVENYREMIKHNWFVNDLKDAVKVVAHKTDYDTTDVNKVWEISMDEFWEMIA